MARDRGGPCRAGVAVTDSDGRVPSPGSTVVAPAASPRTAPRPRTEPSRRAPDTVVTTVPADDSMDRPATSRLSPWWSCVSRTASTAPTSDTGSDGPVSFVDDDPQPKA
jgi:hypothetical protein